MLHLKWEILVVTEQSQLVVPGEGCSVRRIYMRVISISIVQTASNRNEYQENFLGVNAAGAYG